MRWLLPWLLTAIVVAADARFVPSGPATFQGAHLGLDAPGGAWDFVLALQPAADRQEIDLATVQRACWLESVDPQETWPLNGAHAAVPPTPATVTESAVRAGRMVITAREWRPGEQQRLNAPIGVLPVRVALVAVILADGRAVGDHGPIDGTAGWVPPP
ncbi:MAG: hypothetical protein H0W72_16235 [Planctomycetes bacterium]|nr:hypothetical protein [Planctomycetota bacterium]